MSTSLDLRDFENARDRAMHSCTPAPHRTQLAWLGDWREAAARMQYLQIQHSLITESLRSLIRIRGGLKKPNLSLELVKPDVAKLWGELADHASEAGHCFVNTDTGFECYFYAISHNSYVTGTIQIDRHS